MISVNCEEFRTVKEATGLLGVKPATLYAYVSRGVLRSYRQGIKRQRLYRRVEVEGLLRLAPSDARGERDPVPPRDATVPHPAGRVVDPRLTWRPFGAPPSSTRAAIWRPPSTSRAGPKRSATRAPG